MDFKVSMQWFSVSESLVATWAWGMYLSENLRFQRTTEIDCVEALLKKVDFLALLTVEMVSAQSIMGSVLTRLPCGLCCVAPSTPSVCHCTTTLDPEIAACLFLQSCGMHPE